MQINKINLVHLNSSSSIKANEISVTSAADTGLILPLVVLSVSGLKQVGNRIF